MFRCGKEWVRYEQTFAHILLVMLQGSPNSVKLEDVAAHAGIAVATASRALNGKGRMSSATRETILKVAKELGYQPDRFAQRLVNGRSQNLITLFPPSDLGMATLQAYFIEHHLDALGFEVQAQNMPIWVNHHIDKQVAMFNRARRQRPGAIILGTTPASEALQELQAFIDEGGVIVSYWDKTDLECDQVVFDSEHRAYLATRHLLKLGHRELGFCIHGLDLQDSLELTGFTRAMDEFGARIQKEWLFVGGQYEEGGARLAEAFLHWPSKPTGLCIINDVSASAFVSAVSRNGFNVPDDVSVVGFDDARAARYAFVPLTTVRYPLEEIGLQVVEFTHSRLQGYNGPPRVVTVQSELITRCSTAPFKGRRRVTSKRSASARKLSTKNAETTSV
jgi:LacI family transcriptional regulator